jgi:hypothetical protein
MNMYKLFGWIINRIRKQVIKLILIRFMILLLVLSYVDNYRIMYRPSEWVNGCFWAKYKARSKDYWLTRNQNNVPQWSYMSIRGLLFQWASTTRWVFDLVLFNCLRDGPFNFQGGEGGYVFFLKQIFWFPMLLKKYSDFGGRKEK